MSELSRDDIRKLVMEAMLSSGPKKEAHKSEMREFAASKSGAAVMREGRKIASCSETIKQIAEDQTGGMRRTLNEIATFVEKTGSCLAEMGSLNEGSSMNEGLPTVAELKKLQKEIAKLEK